MIGVPMRDLGFGHNGRLLSAIHNEFDLLRTGN
jgi:hypothetical protein